MSADATALAARAVRPLLQHGSGGSALLKLVLCNYVAALSRHGAAVDVAYRAAAAAVWTLDEYATREESGIWGYLLFARALC